MKILLIGATGMLGQDLHEALSSLGHKVIAFDSQTIDITHPDTIFEVLMPDHDANFLINCAAYTQVDDCETNEDRAFPVNGEGPGNLAAFCETYDIPMIHFSTDYVFDGSQETPYTESDPTQPINIYGASKHAGETAIRACWPKHYIIRVQWLFGKNGPNFIETMLHLAKEQRALDIVCDQWGSPTWTEDIATWITILLELKPAFGTYHLRSAGTTNWYEYAQFIFDTMDLSVELTPCASDAFPRPAARPLNSVLDISKLNAAGLPTLRRWEDAVSDYLTPANSDQ